MILKIINLGQNPKQKQRFRESYLSNQIISHKEDLFKKGLKTRPVINGTGSFLAGGGELYSMTLAGIATLKDGKKRVTSTEELMRAVERINEMVKEHKWKIYKESDDEQVRKELSENPDATPPVILMATDGVALYPSLEKHETARRIRRFIEKSEVTFEDIDITEALVYLKLNEDTLEKQGSLEQIKGFLPTPKNGRKKFMTHPTVRGPHTARELDETDKNKTDNTKKDKNPWIFKNEPSNPQTIREIIARVMEVNTINLFGNFVYEFGGELFQQSIGGPTGTQPATIAAMVAMEETLDEVEEDADREESPVHNIGDKVYVDDIRGWWFVFRPGTRYEDGKFIIKSDPITLEEDSKITLGELTRREILKCMNSKNEHIQFTAEKPSDFEDDDCNIPTLDFKIGINEECDEYILRFYEKPMASKYFTPADSAMAKQQRDQIVANDVTRMMRRMSPKLVEKETEDVVVVLNNANNRLKFSGYSFPERHKVIEAGITNYRKRKLASKVKGQRMFLTEEEARSERDKKKLGVKEMWYRLPIVTKKKERNQKGFWKKKKRRMTHEEKVKENQLQSQSSPQEEVKVKTKVIPDEVISVLFVPRTPHSELAKMLRKDEKEISTIMIPHQDSRKNRYQTWRPP